MNTIESGLAGKCSMQEAERLALIEMNADYDARLAARRAAEQPFREPVVALAGVTVTVVAFGVSIFFAGMLYGRWYWGL